MITALVVAGLCVAGLLILTMIVIAFAALRVASAGRKVLRENLAAVRANSHRTYPSGYPKWGQR